MTERWRESYYEELDNLFSSSDIIRVIRSEKVKMSEARSMHGQGMKGLEHFIQNTEGKRTTRRKH